LFFVSYEARIRRTVECCVKDRVRGNPHVPPDTQAGILGKFIGNSAKRAQHRLRLWREREGALPRSKPTGLGLLEAHAKPKQPSLPI
jgi:hypothetical protein